MKCSQGTKTPAYLEGNEKRLQMTKGNIRQLKDSIESANFWWTSQWFTRTNTNFFRRKRGKELRFILKHLTTQGFYDTDVSWTRKPLKGQTL